MSKKNGCLLNILLYECFVEETLHLMAILRWNRLVQLYKLPLAFSYLEETIDKDTGNIRYTIYMEPSLINSYRLITISFDKSVSHKSIEN